MAGRQVDRVQIHSADFGSSLRKLACDSAQRYVIVASLRTSKGVAYGPKPCGCCGAVDGVEAHHLYLRAEGCPDDLTVWLCNVCHCRSHGMSHRINISAAVKAGQARARKAGKRLGRPIKVLFTPTAVAQRLTCRMPQAPWPVETPTH